MKSLKHIYFDTRAIGEHGIGKCAQEIYKRLPTITPFHNQHNPTSALDCIRLSWALWRLQAKFFYTPGYNPPLFFKGKLVITVHDLNHIDRPEQASFLKTIYYQFVLKRACKKAAYVLTSSTYFKKRVTDWANIPSEKVLAIPIGADNIYTPDGEKLQLDYPYILCVSNRRPHKNEARLIEAFAKANINSEIKLIFSGNPAPESAILLAKYGVENRILFAGIIPEAQLPNYYRGAIAFVFPSLYEGFGLPPLEAMACGCPVVASNSTSIPEVCGDAVLYFDPLNTLEMSEKITEVINNPMLQLTLKQRGIDKAKEYSWDNTVVSIQQYLNKL